MQTILHKINKQRKVYFFISLFFLIPSFTFASAWDFAFEGGDALLIAIGNFLIYIFSIMLYMASIVFDNLLMITLSTELFNSSFVKVAWRNILDIANIGFILGAIYIAFAMMFDRNGGWKKSLIYLVIVIFVINFSLFFSRVIVDAGNITARVFLSSMALKVERPEDHFAAAKAFYPNTNVNSFVSVAASFQKVLRPESLLGIETFEKYKKMQEELKKSDDGEVFLLIAIVMSIAMFTLAKHLFIGGFMFLSRMVWIMVYMISAPAVLITAFIPGYENLWKDKWLKPLFMKSFCIVIYLFFIWLAILILQSGLIPESTVKGDIIVAGDESIAMLLSVFVIKAVLIIQIMKMGTKIGSDWCENGESTFGMLMKGAVAPLMASPLGRIPAKMFHAGRRTALGRVGLAMQGTKENPSRFGKWASTGNFAQRAIGEFGMRFGENMQNKERGGTSFTADNTKREKMRNENRDRMSPEGKKKAELRDYGISSEKDGTLKKNKDGSLNTENLNRLIAGITGFKDPDKNKEWEDTFGSYIRENLSDDDKKIYEGMDEEKKRAFLKEKEDEEKDRDDNYSKNKDAYEMQNRADIVTKLSKTKKGVVSEAIFKAEAVNKPDSLMGMIIPGFAGSYSGIISDNNAARTALSKAQDNRENKKLQSKESERAEKFKMRINEKSSKILEKFKENKDIDSADSIAKELKKLIGDPNDSDDKNKKIDAVISSAVMERIRSLKEVEDTKNKHSILSEELQGNIKSKERELKDVKVKLDNLKIDLSNEKKGSEMANIILGSIKKINEGVTGEENEIEDIKISLEKENADYKILHDRQEKKLEENYSIIEKDMQKSVKIKHAAIKSDFDFEKARIAAEGQASADAMRTLDAYLHSGYVSGGTAVLSAADTPVAAGEPVNTSK